jgi:predicted solute-binding protein
VPESPVPIVGSIVIFIVQQRRNQTTVKFAYRTEFATEPLARALEMRGWETIPADRPGDLLLAGEADVVLTPALDYARCLGLVDYALVEGFGIFTAGFAGLIEILFNKHLVSFQSLAVKDAAAAETIVAKVLLSEKHDIVPKLIQVGRGASLQEMLAAADSALLAGDDAIFEKSGNPSLLDVSDEWEDTTETPLPYMLAWGRVQEVPQGALDDLLAARDQAVLLLPDHVARHSSAEQANVFYQRYLRGNIRYSMENGDIRALDAFFRYAFYHGAIADIPAIKFLPDGAPADLPAPPK